MTLLPDPDTDQTWEEALRGSDSWRLLTRQERGPLLRQARIRDRRVLSSQRLLQSKDVEVHVPPETPFELIAGMTPEEATREKIRRDAEYWPIQSRQVIPWGRASMSPDQVKRRGSRSVSLRRQRVAQLRGPGTVYVIQNISTGLYKIGITTNMQQRMRQLRVGKTSRLIGQRWSSDARAVERAAHQRYKAHRIPQAEYFNLSTPPII